MAKEPQSRLAQIRKAKGLSQQQLADLIDAHWVTLSKLERGKITLTYEWAVRIARALQVDLSAIFESDAHPKEVLISATVLGGGRIHQEGATQWLRVDERYFSSPDAIWYIIDTIDWFPIFQPSDLIRVMPVEPHEANRCRGRLCIVQNAHDQNDLRMGILGRVIPDGGEELLRMNGSAIADMEFFTVLGCVTTAYFAPSLLGELRLKASDEAGQSGRISLSAKILLASK